jgi:hypothetical protein
VLNIPSPVGKPTVIAVDFVDVMAVTKSGGLLSAIYFDLIAMFRKKTCLTKSTRAEFIGVSVTASRENREFSKRELLEPASGGHSLVYFSVERLWCCSGSA